MSEELDRQSRIIQRQSSTHQGMLDKLKATIYRREEQLKFMKKQSLAVFKIYNGHELDSAHKRIKILEVELGNIGKLLGFEKNPNASDEYELNLDQVRMMANHSKPSSNTEHKKVSVSQAYE
jgi:hypothetical protein